MSSMEEETPFIEKPWPQRRKTLDVGKIVPWILVALLSIYVVSTWLFPHISPKAQISWTPSDFVPARSVISRTQTTFTSSLEFTEPKHLYRVFDPSERVYVGDATTEIDQAWIDLIQPAGIYITDEEAATLTLPEGSRLYRSNETGMFSIDLEVFHSLHCLNMIRQRIYSDSYPEMLTTNARVHVDHCIEGLRELIMCGGDMTAIPVEWSSGGQRANPNYAGQHTCRDFYALKEWVKTRHYLDW